ncbi:MAG: Mammalian cell entry related domain protein [Marmoricola sp.]|nr:Mammalian cell entry related domain protein [Marmoricola sp.]
MSVQTRASQWKEKLATVPGLGRDVTAVVLMLVVGLIATVAIKSNLGGTYPWSASTIVRAEFSQVPGLNPQSKTAVTIAGVTVGTVTHTEATDHNTAIITMKLDGSYTFYGNARAVLRPKNPLDEMQIELNQGSPAAAPLASSTPIPVSQTERPVQADDILDHLDARSQQAMTDLMVESDAALTHAPTQLAGGLSQTSATLDALEPVVKALQTRRAKIAQLVTALSEISSAVGQNDQRVTRLAGATEQTLSVLAANDGALRQSINQLPGLSTQLRDTLTSTQALTTQLNPTLVSLNNASGALPPALERFRSTLVNLGKTVDAARPVLDKAVPVIADLRPTVANARTALGTLSSVTGALNADTQTVMSYLTDIKAFVYNTTSVFGAGDANGSIIRGHLMVPLPGGGVLPNPLSNVPGGK